ncbi:MAG: DUF4344 domain-containing metallopeptidase [Xanthobacteraceae bacterium]
MTCLARSVLALALILPALAVAPATAQYRPTPPPGGGAGGGIGPSTSPSGPGNTQPALTNSQVDIVYTEPRNDDFRPIRDRLMRRRVLEQLQQFLSPLRLPRKLLVQVDECGTTKRPYQPGGPAVICYEYVAQIERMAAKQTGPNSLPPDTMVVGAFVQSMLNEVAQGVFDILEIPVWGREEDAADKLAAFIMVQFGKEVARKVLIGAAWFFEVSDRTWTGADFASVHSPESQRFYNYLCVAYGADPATFKFLLNNDLLPARRAQRCAKEYFDLRRAFLRTIMPHVDEARLRVVQSGTWLSLDEPR